MEQHTKIKGREKIIAYVITFFIIATLIVSGPANALNLVLGSFSNADLNKGQKTSALFEIHLRTNERINITAINLVLNNANGNFTCFFDVNGNSLTNCNANLTLLSNNASNGYGYGYGYGYNNNFGYNYGYTGGILVYNLTIDSSNLEAGSYDVYLELNLGNHNYRSDIRQINVLSQIVGISSGGAIFTQLNKTSNQSINGQNLSDNNQNHLNENITKNDTITEENSNLSNITSRIGGITGAVIGAIGSKGGILVFFIIVLFATGAIILKIYRKKKF